jgi:dTDP-4-amino-4,6-dideoxygalactose transaminase
VVSEILGLPVHAALGDDDVRRVAEAVRSATGELSA